MTLHKAYAAAIVAAISAFVASVQGRPTLDGMGFVDWLLIVLAAVVAGAVTYQAPYRAKGQRVQ